MGIAQNAFKKASGCLGIFIGGVLVIAMSIGGLTEMWKKNTPTEGNLKQFLHGATGNYFRDEPKDLADKVYDDGKGVIEDAGEFLEQVKKRLEEEFSDGKERNEWGETREETWERILRDSGYYEKYPEKLPAPELGK